MDPGLEIKYVWNDEDVVEIRLSASNGSFAGVMEAYFGVGELAEIAESLTGFPTNHNDTRDISFGSTSMSAAGGAASLHFFCMDRTGTAFIDVSIVADPVSFDGGQRARFALPIEAHALDVFVTNLRVLEQSKNQAVLAASGRNWHHGTSRAVLKHSLEKLLRET